MLRYKSWLIAFGVLVGVSGLLCVMSIFAGRRFAKQTIFQELNALASIDQANDVELLGHLKSKLPEIVDHESRTYIQKIISSMENRPSGFICIDDATKNLFSLEQQATLEKSLKSYYGQVYWGKDNIPPERYDTNGEPIGGFVLGYSFKIYPGIVKISTHSWSGLVSGGGHTNVYVWKGSGFHFHKQSEMWRS